MKKGKTNVTHQLAHTNWISICIPLLVVDDGDSCDIDDDCDEGSSDAKLVEGEK